MNSRTPVLREGRFLARRSLILFLHLACIAAIAAASLSALAASEVWADRPSILWIYVDNMSNWMGCYGYPVAQTPNIDSLAEGGVLFENAFMPAPVCSTTRSALITDTMS